MKRINRVFLIALLIMAFASSCFAATDSSDLLGEPISPKYVGTHTIMTMFNIKNEGTATMRGALTPKNKTVIDNVKISFAIKDTAGNTIYNKTYTATWSDLYGQYIVEKSYDLKSKGTYTLKATYACYKNGVLVERINSTGIIKTYK